MTIRIFGCFFSACLPPLIISKHARVRLNCHEWALTRTDTRTSIVNRRFQSPKRFEIISLFKILYLFCFHGDGLCEIPRFFPPRVFVPGTCFCLFFYSDRNIFAPIDYRIRVNTRHSLTNFPYYNKRKPSHKTSHKIYFKISSNAYRERTPYRPPR